MTLKQSKLLGTVLVLCMLCQKYTVGLGSWSTMQGIPSARWMAWQMKTRGLEDLANMENITIFLPSSDAFFKFSPHLYGMSNDDVIRWRELLTYSTIEGRWKLSDIRKKKKLTSRLKFSSSIYLYVNTFNTKDGVIMTINGARIIHADIVTDNGIIHIVDMFIAPVGSPHTIAEYLGNPELPKLEFSAIMMSRFIVPELANQTNNTSGLFTSFSPNDSYLYPMPEYGSKPLFDNIPLLRDVYLSHMIENEALFLPDSMREISNRQTMLGKNSVIRFYRWQGSVYIVNNGVHAKVIHANIPTSNGVIHVIDNLLHYVYHNAVQIAQHHPDTDIWGQLVHKLSNVSKKALTDKSVTVFMPTDGAFSKMPLFYQAELRQESREDMPMLERVLFGHFVPNSKFESSELRDGQTFKVMNNQTLTVKEIRGDLYLQTSDQRVRSKIEVRDIGIKNGVVHLVSNVLFADNYTVWQALGDIPALSRIHDRLVVNFGELRTLMSDKQPITVFLPSNAVLERISDYLDYLLVGQEHILLEALRGHIVSGQLTSSQLVRTQTHMTWSGKIIQTSWSENPDGSVITVAGGHVISHLVLRDIYCSNGVLHVIDDLLHIPTRTIWAELQQRGDLMRYFQHMLVTINDPSYDLNDKGKNYTIFVPSNDAFAYLPWETVDRLLVEVDWTKEVLKAHIVENETQPLEEIPDEIGLVAKNNLIYLLRSNDRVYVVNNNMMAEVIKYNIPAVNGWIHVIDRILTVPYVTVAQTMMSRPELRAFHKLMQSLPEYQELVTSSDPKVQKVKRMVTLFIPSTRYINTLEPDQLDYIRSNTNIIRKLFYGHVMPDVRMDEEFLRQYADHDYKSRTEYNMSFTISKKDGNMYVGVGFDIQHLDLIGMGLGCSDGIIHVINGFLNYSPYTVWERLIREPGVSQSFEHISQLASPTDQELLNDQHKTFTFLMPDDFALDYFTFNDLLKLHSLPVDEQQRIFWRHVINGSIVLYDDFKNGYVNTVSLPHDVSITVVNEAVDVKYGEVSSRIKIWNLIACNGIIHIIQQYLYDVNMQNDDAKTTATPSPSRPSPNTAALEGASTQCPSTLFIIASFLIWLVLNRSLVRVSGR